MRAAGNQYIVWVERLNGVKNQKEGGKDSSGAVYASNTLSEAISTLEGAKTPLVPRYFYQVSTWVRGEQLSENATIHVRLNLLKGKENMVLNCDYLYYELQTMLTFGEQNNVPLYLEEYRSFDMLMKTVIMVNNGFPIC